MSAATIRRLVPEDAAAMKALRMEGLTLHPDAFGTSPDEEEARPLADVAAMIANAAPGGVFGAFVDGSLVGIAGFAVEQRRKRCHLGRVWGVYVRAGYRGQGIARGLMERIIADARSTVLVLQLTVVTQNEEARGLYRALGFTPYGLERRALRIGDHFLDEELLALDFHE